MARTDPGSPPLRTLSSLTGRHVVTQTGRHLGRCRDLEGELDGAHLYVTGLYVGRTGVLEHLGIRPRTHRSAIPWEQIVRIDGHQIVIRDD